MQGVKSRALAVLFAMAMAMAIVVAAPLTAYATTPPTLGTDYCAIDRGDPLMSDIGHPTLAAALADASLASGDTIYLLDDISESSLGVIITQNLTIDLRGKNLEIGYLDVNGATVTVIGGGTLSANYIYVHNGGTLDITADIDVANYIAVDGAILDVHGNITTADYGIDATANATVTVTGNITVAAASINYGIVAYTGATVTLVGDITGGYTGVHAENAGTVVTVTGTISGTAHSGIDAHNGAEITLFGDINCPFGVDAEDAGTVVTVTGDITALQAGILTGLGGGAIVTLTGNINAGWGIAALGNDTITVTGNITAVDIGIEAHDGADISVTGTVTATDTNGCGVFAVNGVKVSIVGTINAPRYIVFGTDDGSATFPIETDKTAAQSDASSIMAGYLQYSGGNPPSWVWVKAGTGPFTPPLIPAAGDANNLFVWMVLLMSGAGSLSAYAIRRKARTRG